MNDIILFGNDCTIAEYYKISNIKYNHPFIWAWFSTSNFIKFIENYDNINFNNYNIYKVGDNINFRYMRAYSKHKYLTYYMNIDNIFEFAYSYYIESDKDEKKYNNFYLKDCKNFIINKYNERLKRYNKALKPIFIYNQKEYNSMEDIINFINSKTQYKKIIYTNFKELLKYNTDIIKVIYKENIVFKTSFIDFAKILKTIL